MNDKPANEALKSTGRIAAIDNYRGLCMLAIIIVHATSWFDLLITPFGLHLNNSLIFVVSGFMLLIGVMLGYHYMPRLTSAAARIKIQKRLLWRAVKIMLYVYVFSILFYLVFREPSGYNSCVPDAHRSLQALVDLLTLDRINHRMAILILISFLLLFSQLIIWTHKYSRRWYLMAAAGLVLYLVFLAIYDVFSVSDATLARLPVFLGLKWNFPFLAWTSFLLYGVAIGSLLYKYVSSGRLVKFSIRLILLGTSGIVAWSVFAFTMYKEHGEYVFPQYVSPPSTPYYVLHCLSLCFLVMGLFLLLEHRKIKIPGERLLSVFGQHSLFCFIAQWCVIHAMFLVLVKTHASLYVRWAGLIVTVAIVYLLAVAQARFFARRRAAAKLKAKSPAD